mmetsp:Transcript_97381/g.280961  ORF Transcript_97381/g.280961 Transcript_97381/m.280961 type:complete len:253 (+) Transcript_97381:215-973(+)
MLSMFTTACPEKRVDSMSMSFDPTSCAWAIARSVLTGPVHMDMARTSRTASCPESASGSRCCFSLAGSGAPRLTTTPLPRRKAGAKSTVWAVWTEPRAGIDSPMDGCAQGGTLKDSASWPLISMSLLKTASTRPWVWVTSSANALFCASWLWSTCMATPAPPNLAKPGAKMSTLPGADPSLGLPAVERPATYTIAPDSASICATPLPTPRLAPVTTVTNPANFFDSAVPQIRCVETQAAAGPAPGPETPGTH